MQTRLLDRVVAAQSCARKRPILGARKSASVRHSRQAEQDLFYNSFCRHDKFLGKHLLQHVSNLQHSIAETAKASIE